MVLGTLFVSLAAFGLDVLLKLSIESIFADVRSMGDGEEPMAVMGLMRTSGELAAIPLVLGVGLLLDGGRKITLGLVLAGLFLGSATLGQLLDTGFLVFSFGYAFSYAIYSIPYLVLMCAVATGLDRRRALRVAAVAYAGMSIAHAGGILFEDIGIVEEYSRIIAPALLLGAVVAAVFMFITTGRRIPKVA